VDAGGSVCDSAAASIVSKNRQSTSQLSSSNSSSEEYVWRRSGTYGQWRLVHQSSGRLGASAKAAADAAGGSTRDIIKPEGGKAASKSISVAGAAALVDELAHTAKGLLPQLQSEPGNSKPNLLHVTAVAASGRAGDKAAGVQLSVQEQMQAALAHSARLLQLLCGALQPEVRPLTPGPLTAMVTAVPVA
jgi:hypothetical protein